MSSVMSSVMSLIGLNTDVVFHLSVEVRFTEYVTLSFDLISRCPPRV